MDETITGVDVRDAPPPSADRQAQVLIVEDDPGYRSLLRCGLELEPDADYVVSTAGRLDEALERLADGLPDAILLDLFLPDSADAVTVREVDRAAPDVPIVVVTAHAGSELKRDESSGAPMIVLDKHKVTPHDVFLAIRTMSVLGESTSSRGRLASFYADRVCASG